jgi:hypothetical protein
VNQGRHSVRESRNGCRTNGDPLPCLTIVRSVSNARRDIMGRSNVSKAELETLPGWTIS